MRVTAAVRQHSLHLQVARTNNGKFLVCPNNSQDIGQQPTNDETNSVPAVVFPSYEPVPTDHHGPTILGDRYLLLGPAEGSALYRCVDVHTGQQLVAKVSIRRSFVPFLRVCVNAFDKYPAFHSSTICMRVTRCTVDSGVSFKLPRIIDRYANVLIT